MDVEAIRDWVLIFAIVLWLLLTLVVAVVLFALAYFTRRGFRAADRAVGGSIRPGIAAVYTQLMGVREFTARLPGGTPIPEGEARPVSPRRRLSLPFRKKRRGFRLGR